MPEVYVHAVAGRSVEQKRALAREITEAVVRHFNVTADRVLVEFIENAPHNKAKGGVLFTDRQSG
jgi:4-oxalocrotonate tautomerase